MRVVWVGGAADVASVKATAAIREEKVTERKAGDSLAFCAAFSGNFAAWYMYVHMHCARFFFKLLFRTLLILPLVIP